MKRDIYHQLKSWKLSKRRKPLIINGARQVGKTHALKYFGATYYDNVVYLNFEKNENLSGYFDITLDPKELVKILSIHSDIDIKPSETLIILDEIQECPKALNSLKYFYEEANEYHVIAAGSLLGVKTNRSKGFPVGKVSFLYLYPMTFFEFLSALKHDKLRDLLESTCSYDSFPDPIHSKLIELLKLYLFIGGMPEVVSEYIESENLKIVREIQLEILDAYERDFAKHVLPKDIPKISTVWDQVHRQLAKENKKFIFSAIRQSARGKEYEDAIQWLQDAGMIHKSHCIKTPKFPLSAYADSHIFKVFLLDVGLLGAQSHLSAQTIISGHLLFTEFKGSLLENYVAQELVASRTHKLYYWTSSGTAEVDFLIEENHEVFPLEVKSGENNKKKSLLSYKEKYQSDQLLRTTLMNLKHDGKIYNYPLYLISRILTF
ncbi:MAG: AAA family ATPase [Rhabdochlamydiaceae bacterium]|nr:AAA family ATPase [Candidatus Amphrikana amoebophyrae]